jgi:hypothetical protein
MGVSDMFRTSTRFRRFSGSTDGVVFHCPGCDDTHQISLAGPTHWTCEGEPDRPTFWPSLKVTTPTLFSDEVCHSFITLGRIAFLPDSTHKLAGQTVEIPDWPHARGAYGGILEPPKKPSTPTLVSG